MAEVRRRAAQPFTLSMLIYDRRYRGIIIQIFVFLAVMLAARWLIDNVHQNMLRQGKSFDFSFLWNRAGYDIPFHIIPYNSNDSHLRAAMVGLLNTLLVSALACLFATILGVLVGVLRLSGNWLIARLMTVYVEVFRNIPLLLWILVILAAFTEALPAPRDYKGDEASAHMILGLVAPTNRYTAVPAISFDRALPPVLGLDGALFAFAAMILIGWVLARMISRRAEAVQNATGRRPSTWWAIALAYAGPLVAMWLLLGGHFTRPALKGFNFSGGANLDNGFVVLVLALTLYTGAFIAEIVRGGVLSVSRGQSEAAAALGLRPNRITSLVVLPQALRVIVPPLISQFLNITKNSTLAIAVGFPDLRATLGGTTLNQTGREMESMVLMMGIYLALSLIISGVMNVYNASVKLKER